MMKLIINQQTVILEDDSPRPLLWVLRDELGLMGTKFGCGAGICGACTVQVDGEATRACITPITMVEGKQIRTIEGMSTQLADGSWQLHPVQQAFLAEQAPQCGWCMSGQMMTAVSFLEQNPQPTETEIVAAMGNNYCRCGSYVRIKKAVAQASQLLNGGDT